MISFLKFAEITSLYLVLSLLRINDVRIIIKQNYNKIYELNAVGVNDVEYLEETDGKEVLKIALNEKEILMLTVNPNLEINHYYENAP